MVIRVREQTGHIDFSPLQMHWQALEQLTDDVERLDSQPPSSVLTRRLIDEGQIAGRRVTFAAQRYLRMANEHHEALQSQLEHFGVRHWTHWSLLRPQFEASFWVLWLLDPDEGAERRRRGLRCEATDAKACARWLDSQVGAGLDAELVAEAKQTNFAASHNTYRAEATQLNLSPSRLYNPVNVVDELPKLQFDRFGLSRTYGSYMVSVWRRLSAAEHGLSYALLRGSDQMRSTTTAGGVSVFLSPKDSEVTSTCKFVAMLNLAALRRYIDWSSRT